MTKRIERARYLGEQLTAAMGALASGTQGVDVVLFLEHLARLEGYPSNELEEELRVLISDAQAARTEHSAELGMVAGQSLDIERFLDVGRHLPEPDITGAHDGWLRDLLLLATLVPYLSKARQMVVHGAIAKATAMVEAEPEAFLGASVLAEDRRSLEQPSTLSAEAREVLALLEEVPLLVVFDRAPLSSSSRVEKAIWAVDENLMDEADDALLNRERRLSLRLPSAREERMAAADETAVILLSMETGRWVYLQRAGQASLRFEPTEVEVMQGPFVPAEVGVEVMQGPSVGTLPLASGGFSLPASADGLTLKLTVGSDSRVVTLASSGQ